MTPGAREFDVVICGGGMVGASLAAALAPLPLRIALAEAVPFQSDAQPSFDDRTIALSRTSQRILAGIGAWPGIAPEACAIREIHVSERGRFGNAVISGEEQGVGELGHVVANRVVGAALWRIVGSSPAVSVFCPGSVVAARPAGDRVEVTLRDGSGDIAARSRLLVVADGARSALREALGVAARERSYGQTAIVGNVALVAGRSGSTAYERFTADGPVALLPFRDGRFVFVMARDPQGAEAAMALDDAAFLDLLQQSFGSRLGRFARLGRRAAYPLSLVQAGQVVAERAAIIGNAAHGLHPVAGQGYNLGLRDVAALAELVADATRSGGDPGDPALLARYAQWRAGDQRNVVAFTDGLIRLFELPTNTVGVARGLGLLAFDLMPGAKRALARRTMGMAGSLSRLARGLPL